MGLLGNNVGANGTFLKHCWARPEGRKHGWEATEFSPVSDAEGWDCVVALRVQWGAGPQSSKSAVDFCELIRQGQCGRGNSPGCIPALAVGLVEPRAVRKGWETAGEGEEASLGHTEFEAPTGPASLYSSAYLLRTRNCAKAGPQHPGSSPLVRRQISSQLVYKCEGHESNHFIPFFKYLPQSVEECFSYIIPIHTTLLGKYVKCSKNKCLCA